MSRIARLLQVLMLKEKVTQQASNLLARAREQFLAAKTKHDQLAGYRQDYVQQLSVVGDETYTIQKMRNRIDFIAQLDTVLSQLNQQLAQLAKQRSRCESDYLVAKSAQDAVKRLIEQVEMLEKTKRERAEQKESDEYAQKQWYSKKSTTTTTKKRIE